MGSRRNVNCSLRSERINKLQSRVCLHRGRIGLFSVNDPVSRHSTNYDDSHECSIKQIPPSTLMRGVVFPNEIGKLLNNNGYSSSCDKSKRSRQSTTCWSLHFV